jgi:hypothetical protein
MTILPNRVKTDSRLTKRALEACRELRIRPKSIDPVLLQEMRDAAGALNTHEEYDMIRELFDRFNAVKNCKSYLCVLFQMRHALVGKVLRDADYGKRAMGRTPSLTLEEVGAVIQHVESCQISGKCPTVLQVTEWVNNNLLHAGRSISERYLRGHAAIRAKLDIKVPVEVEEQRLQASTYANVKPFFVKLSELYRTHKFDPDLVINFDETKAHAGPRKKSAQVMYNPKLGRPTSATHGLQEMITLSCGVSASGKCLLPTFIIKNKTVTCEGRLFGPEFAFGKYGIQYSSSGWQTEV